MTTTTETALTLPQRAALALLSGQTEQTLIALAAQAKEFQSITNAAGREDCHSRYMALKNARVAVEKTGKAAREDATAFSKAVIAEEKRLVSIVESEEARLQAIRDKWDAEIEAERQRKAEIERQRVAAIEAKIAAIVAVPNHVTPIDSSEIKARIDQLQALVIDLDGYAEHTGRAQVAKDETLAKLANMLEARLAYEAEQQRLAEEAEARRKQEEAERIECERLAEQQRKELEAERQRLAAQQAAIAEQARIQAEADAKARREAEEAQRIEREKLEAERRELDRQKAEAQAKAEAAADQLRRDQEALERQRAELEAKASAAVPAAVTPQVDLAKAGGSLFVDESVRVDEQAMPAAAIIICAACRGIRDHLGAEPFQDLEWLLAAVADHQAAEVAA